jgi:hypothetical protein
VASLAGARRIGETEVQEVSTQGESGSILDGIIIALSCHSQSMNDDMYTQPTQVANVDKFWFVKLVFFSPILQQYIETC